MHVAALLSAGERLPAEARHAGRSDLLTLLEGAMGTAHGAGGYGRCGAW